MAALNRLSLSSGALEAFKLHSIAIATLTCIKLHPSHLVINLTKGPRKMTISHENLKSILGDLDDAKIIQILALNPTVADLEEAAIWATGNGDVLGKAGRPLSGTAVDILEILTADEEEEPPPAR